MNRMHLLLPLIFMLGLFQVVQAQDTIQMKDGHIFLVEDVLIERRSIQYCFFTEEGIEECNLAKIRNVECIKKESGEIITFEKREVVSSYPKYRSLFLRLTEQHNNVFIESENADALIYAKNALKDENYWEIVEDVNEADFILRFDLVYRSLEAISRAHFIDPTTNVVIYSTKAMNSKYSLDVNWKRGAIDLLVYNEIVPLFPEEK